MRTATDPASPVQTFPAADNMALSRLSIRSFRALRACELQPAPQLNLIHGLNAAGKTTLLEAIYFLSRGRSFRTGDWTKLLTTDAAELSVSATTTEDGHTIPLGISRSREQLNIRIAGRPVNALAELAIRLPVLLLDVNSHQLLEAGPGVRRRFLDWGVFHVEQSFFPAWRRYQRALKQRNAALRQGIARPDIWDSELVEAATELNGARERYIRRLSAELPGDLNRLFPGHEVELTYQTGWRAGAALDEVLKEGLQQDRQAGFTRQGPHRAEIQIRVNGKTAPEGLSHGQQKLLVSAMMMAQSRVVSGATGRQTIFLVDDLPAELDRQNRMRLLEALLEQDAQLFLTTIEPDAIALPAGLKQAVFHVEHGEVHS